VVVAVAVDLVKGEAVGRDALWALTVLPSALVLYAATEFERLVRRKQAPALRGPAPPVT
jgi:hypothetical protein